MDLGKPHAKKQTCALARRGVGSSKGAFPWRETRERREPDSAACLRRGLILQEIDLRHTDQPDETKLQISGSCHLHSTASCTQPLP